MKKFIAFALTLALLMMIVPPVLPVSRASYGTDPDFVQATAGSAVIPTRTNVIFDGSDNLSNTTGFAPGRVIVRAAGGIAHSAAQGDFFGVEVDCVDDLMQLTPEYNAETRALSLPDSLMLLTLKDKSAEAVYEAIEILGNEPGIVYAEPDYIVTAAATIPNDLDFNTPSMWGMQKIYAPDAWDIDTGSSEVIVAVIDSGIDYTHPDLAANMWRNPGEIAGDEIDNDGNGFVDDIYGWGYLWGEESSNSVMDTNGHGTHVAGIIGAVGNNGIGIAGVSWNTKLMAIKVMNNVGWGFTSDIVLAVDYARLMKAPIINNSYGGDEYSQAQKDAIDSCDALFVVAAGNDGTDNDLIPTYPANYDCDNIITVAATGRDDTLTGFSNYGAASVHIAAPGDGIFSTTPVGTYSVMSGTSMATPYVAGAAALVLSKNPGMTTQELKERLITSVDKIPELNGKVSSGGRLNVHRALNPNAPSKPPYVPKPLPELPEFTGFAGGDGSLNNPYKVSTPMQLYAVRFYSDSNFLQINDVDLTYDTQNPNGLFYNETNGWEPIDFFTGTYDGGGHKIIGMRISRSFYGVFGLFGSSAGFILNLGMVDGDVVCMQGGSLAGANQGVVLNCYNTGSVTTFGGSASGLVSQSRGGRIINCWNSGDISDISDYVSSVGGISSEGGYIVNCYNTGNLFAPYALDNRIGGIMECGFGSRGDYMENCYNTGTTTNSKGSGKGSVLNYMIDDMVIKNCYILGMYKGIHGTVLTEAEMKERSSFVGWNFTTVWQLSPGVNNGYPHLRQFAPIEGSGGFAGGNGTPWDPYIVSTPEHLNKVRDNLTAHYIQINDIDLTYDTQNPRGLYYNSGKGWLPIGGIEEELDGGYNFYGTYDGGGHKITGLYINRTEYAYAGLFAHPAGLIKNLALVDADVTSGSYAGAIAANNIGAIERCCSSGSVTAMVNEESKTAFAGGIAGCITYGSISDCYSTADVEGSSPRYTHYNGGISGGIWYSGSIENCYSTGSVTGTSRYSGYLGGIVGWADGEIISSYCLNLYGQWERYLGTQLTTEQMTIRSSFTDWDFDTIWAISPDYNNGYPTLKTFQFPIEFDNSIILSMTDLKDGITLQIPADIENDIIFIPGNNLHVANFYVNAENSDTILWEEEQSSIRIKANGKPFHAIVKIVGDLGEIRYIGVEKPVSVNPGTAFDGKTWVITDRYVGQAVMSLSESYGWRIAAVLTDGSADVLKQTDYSVSINTTGAEFNAIIKLARSDGAVKYLGIDRQ